MPNRGELSIGSRTGSTVPITQEKWKCVSERSRWGSLTLCALLTLSACTISTTSSVTSAAVDAATCKKLFPNGVPPDLKGSILEIPGLEQQPGEERDEFGLLPFRPTPLTHEQLARFDQWWNSGEVLAWRKETNVNNPNDPTYDYAGAFIAGLEPKLVREQDTDGVARRWRSVAGGRWLKSIIHPTFITSKTYEVRAQKCRVLHNPSPLSSQWGN